MKIEYAVTIEDFRALQPPVVARPFANAGFKAVIGACGAVAALGVYGLIAGLGAAVGGLLIGLGAASGVLSYLYDARAVRRAKANYERGVLAAYARVHCRDRRIFAASEDGFTLSCNCGSLARPWEQLLLLSENDKFFLLRTKAEATVVPKAAFPSEGERTEFRRLATEAINQTRAFASRAIEFVLTDSEHRSARLLHFWKGGGWRLLLRGAAILAALAIVIGIFLDSRGGSSDRAITFKATALLLGVFLTVVATRLLRITRQQRRPIRVHFGSEGLHLEDQATIARYSWDKFCGFLENHQLFLLYHNPRLYRILPKRALASREAEFRALLNEKLRPFDYRRPRPLLQLS